MILTIFAIFLFLSIACIIIGYITKSPPVALAGYLFLFILGLTILLGSLQYPSGEIKTYGYGNGTIVLSENVTTSYANYSAEIIQGVDVNHVFGFFLILLAVFGWIITLTNLERFDDKQDAYKEYRRGGNNGEE